MSPPKANTGVIPSLNGLRAVSFLIVFVAHAGLENIVPGRLGVAVFFFLSGYLITTLMIRERAETGSISLRDFYIRRTLRIFPTMYAILALTLLYLYVTHQTRGITFAGVSSQLFYYQNYYFHGGKGLIPGLGVLWSLAVEEHFYLLFPPLMLLLLRFFKMSYDRIAITLLCICAVILVWRCFVVMTFSNGLEWARDTTDCRADSILFGCVLACFETTAACPRVFAEKRLERIILPSAIVVLLATLVVRNPVFRETLRYSLQGIALAPILYYVVHWPGNVGGRMLNTRVLDALGRLSYAMYLIHYTVLLEFQRMFATRLFDGAAGFSVTVALASLILFCVEKPMDAVRRRFRPTSTSQQTCEQSNIHLTHGSGAGAKLR